MCNVRLEETTYRGEKCSIFHASVLSTYTVQYSNSNGCSFKQGHPLSSQDASVQPFIDDCLVYLQSRIEHEGNNNNYIRSGSDQSTILNQGKNPTRRQKRRKTTQCEGEGRTDNSINLKIGDLLTFLTFSTSTRSKVLVLFVIRFWPERVDDDRQLIMFLYRDDRGHIIGTSLPSFSLPTLVSNKEEYNQDKTEHSGDKPTLCFTTGRLSNHV